MMAIPSQHMRGVLTVIKPWILPRHLLILVNKGIEISSGMLPNEIVLEVLGDEIGTAAVFLSGPSFAVEVVNRQPVSNWKLECSTSHEPS